jgi:hypothetical protein
MKYILNILFVVAILMVSCKKQEVIERANDSTFEMKSGTSTPTTSNSSDGGIIETEDEDDKSKKKGAKGSTSK